MERECRYLVFKYKDVLKHLSKTEQRNLIELSNKVDAGRRRRRKGPVECVVVEHDWPEYEPTWAAIEKRMDETPND